VVILSATYLIAREGIQVQLDMFVCNYCVLIFFKLMRLRKLCSPENNNYRLMQSLHSNLGRAKAAIFAPFGSIYVLLATAGR